MQLGPISSQTSTSKMWDWMIPVAMLAASVAAFIASISFAVFSIKTWTAKRNADLVNIGIGVLRVDPDKEKQIGAAREWALNLIDANAGGVTFSSEARAQLLREPLVSFYPDTTTSFYPDTTVKPAPRRAPVEPQR